jgi:hypothetical protein
MEKGMDFLPNLFPKGYFEGRYDSVSPKKTGWVGCRPHRENWP